MLQDATKQDENPKIGVYFGTFSHLLDWKSIVGAANPGCSRVHEGHSLPFLGTTDRFGYGRLPRVEAQKIEGSCIYTGEHGERDEGKAESIDDHCHHSRAHHDHCIGG
jgi:hypothetical protein